MRGFTLVELIVVLGILFSLLAFSVPSLTQNQRQTEIDSAGSLLISDLRNQQIKSMLGDTETAATATSAGIYFQTDRYTLFRGQTYSAQDSGNVVVILDPQFEFTATNFPSSQIVFARGSGEAGNFTSDSYSLTLTDIQSQVSRVITVNKYGVVQAVD